VLQGQVRPMYHRDHIYQGLDESLLLLSISDYDYEDSFCRISFFTKIFCQEFGGYPRLINSVDDDDNDDDRS
jgi:hypothetical protein